jgi:ABC-type transport system substrate-binding protein
MTVAAPDCNYGTADNPAKLKSIAALDQYTVQFTLCQPDPDFASKVAFGVYAITSKTYLDANGGDSVKMSAAPDGTGPYMLKEWVRGDHITLVANPNYWGPAPKAKTLIFKWTDNASQRLLQLQSGTADGMDLPDPNDYQTIQNDSTLKLYQRPPLNFMYLSFNNKDQYFKNEKVRQAVAMAINKKRIVDSFYPTGSTVTDQIAPPGITPGYTPNQQWYAYDPTAAKKLLADAGFPNGFTTTLSYRNKSRPYQPQPKQIVQEVQSELAKIGITVTINEVESTTFLNGVNEGKYPFAMVGWIADYPGATDFLDYHLNNPTLFTFGDPYQDIVTELQAAAKISDPAQRQAHYDKVNNLVYQHVPMIPVANGTSATVFKAGVQNGQASPLGNEQFYVMTPVSGDQLVFAGSAEPGDLWPADTTDGEELRVTEQIYDALLGYKINGVEIVPGLAEKWEANSDATQWTFHLRQNAKFNSGKPLDANDVVATYAAQWDASSPNHKGHTGDFAYWGTFFGAFLNAKK